MQMQGNSNAQINKWFPAYIHINLTPSPQKVPCIWLTEYQIAQFCDETEVWPNFLLWCVVAYCQVVANMSCSSQL